MKTEFSPRDIVRSGLCIGCGSCAASSAKARMELDGFGHFKPNAPVIWMEQRSEQFAQICPFSPAARDENQLAAALFPAAAHVNAKVGRFENAYVGAVAEGEFRARGSSGGMVSWVLEELLRQGLVDGVAHVAPCDPDASGGHFFAYRIARSVEEVRGGAKSRYYPVEMAPLLEQIRATPGRYAVVGVPCFIKALQLRRERDPLLRERIAFTLGLFCGHMKSARFVESFAWQMGAAIEEVRNVEYRLKDPSRAASTYTAQLTLKDGRVLQKDWWNLADGDWGAGFFQNSACNFCDDVVAEVADISFGDAWVEPYSSDGRGTNVVVVRSPAMQEIVTRAMAQNRLQLQQVDAAFIERTQAAGFRQRREGLAYRLRWPHYGVAPRKRVQPSRRIPARRKLIYRMRAFITWGSARAFWLARRAAKLEIYLRWARWALTTYHALAYGRGQWGERLERWEQKRNRRK